MIKKIMIAGILLLSFFALNAKAKNLCLIEKAFTIYTGYGDRDLIDKIAADNDFREFYACNVEFANKILQTKSGSLFHKYLQKTITASEKMQLLINLDINDIKEFDGIAVKLNSAAISFVSKFPVLRQMQERQQKELLVSAFEKLSNDNSISIKFSKFRTVTPEQCFWWWMACNTACVISCSSTEGNSCYWECASLCAAMYGLCWLWAE